MKLLICIPSYELKNREHLHTILKEYDFYTNMDIDIHLFLTKDIETPHTKHLYDASLKEMLAHEYKKIFEQHKDDYDWFLFSEDDILIKESVLTTCMEETEKMSYPYVCGMMRYEYKPNSDYKYLIDHHPAHSIHRGGNKSIKSIIISDNRQYIDFYNVHQASSLLNKKTLQIVMQNENYFKNREYVGILESAGSGVYYNCGITKLIPVNKSKDLLIHHLPNRYVNMLPDVYNENETPNEIKLETNTNRYV